MVRSALSSWAILVARLVDFKSPARVPRYAFTALARGGWDGRWEDRRDRGYLHTAPGFRPDAGGHGRRSERQADSRFDPRYENDVGGYNDQPVGASGLPIPSFAPLPSYAGGDDSSSVGGDSAYDSQYGGSRASLYSQRKEDRRGPTLGYFVGGTSGGNYYNGGDAKTD